MSTGPIAYPDNPRGAAFFAPSDYAGFWRRVLAAAIDLSVIVALWLVWVVVLLGRLSFTDLTIILGFAFFGYAAVLRWSPTSTLGYRICRIRIVNHRAERPSLPHFVLRVIASGVFPYVFGPLDFLWIFNDPMRQTLHDRWAHTYVVKAGATPVGLGDVAYDLYDIFTWSFVFPETRPGRPAVSAPAGSSGGV